MGSAETIRSPSTTIRSRSTPCVAGCWGPMLRTMSADARPPAPRPTVSSRPPVVVMPVSLPYAAVRARRKGGSARAAGDVVGGGQPAPVVEADDDGVLPVAEGGELLDRRRPGLQRLVGRDAVVVEDPGVRGERDRE